MFEPNADMNGFCRAGAAGCPVFDRPAPADPGERHESPTGKIPHQKQKSITAALRWHRENVRRVSTKMSHDPGG